MDRISYTNKATIPSGLPYSNVNPCYTMTREFLIVTDDQKPTEEERQFILNEQFQQIKTYVDGMIAKDFQSFKDYMKQTGCGGHRFTEVDGERYPHVTGIITPETPKIPHIEEHAILGTMLDEAVKIWMDQGIWMMPEVVTTPNVKVTAEELVGLMVEWFENNPLVRLTSHSEKVVNKEFKYVGELDAQGYIDRDFGIFDFKKTKTITKVLYEKYFMQMAAYSKCLEVEPEFMCIISPFNKPIIEPNVDRYFNKFLMARGRYQERYSI